MLTKTFIIILERHEIGETMKNLLIMILMLITAFISVACDSNDKEAQVHSKPEYKTILQEEAMEMIKEYKDSVILDVRTLEEHEERRILGSILIPLDKIEVDAEEILTDKNAKILVYCRSGNRSAKASRILADLGYTNVYNIGGINSWPYEIEKGKP